MKPDWKDAPAWANWLAMDDDGWWYWYEIQPKWNRFGVWDIRGAGQVVHASARRIDPQKSKERRP